jgi:hypothetical protein
VYRTREAEGVRTSEGCLTFFKKMGGEMRTLGLAMLAATGLALAACNNETPSGPEVGPVDGNASLACGVTGVRFFSNPITVSRNTTNHIAAWSIRNTGTTNVVLQAQQASRSGRVTAVRTTTWTSFPRTLAPGERIDADVFFDVGAAGTGVVTLKVFNSCAGLILTYNVTVQ